MRRGTLRLAVVLALAAGPVAPAQAADSRGAPSSWPGLHSLWSWLVAVIAHQPAFQTTCDWGSQIDPNGGCRAAAALQTACDRGSQIDPDGGCRAAANAAPDESLHIDPDG
jgi:hypothetical protein